MSCIVLVPSDERILVCYHPNKGWQESGLTLDAGSSIKQIDESSFLLRSATAEKWVGRFTLDKKGQLSMQHSPRLPTDVRSVIAVSDSGHLLLVNTESPTFLRQSGDTWKTIAKLPTTDEPYLDGRFDNNERYICVLHSYRLLVNSSATLIKVFRIGQTRVDKVGFGDPQNLVGSLSPSKGGWFFDSAGLTYFLPLSTLPQNRENRFREYGSGDMVGPAIGSDIALFRSKDGNLRMRGRIVGRVPKEYRMRRPISTLWYWAGVGAVSLIPRWDEAAGELKEAKVYINERPMSGPPLDVRSLLFLVSS